MDHNGLLKLLFTALSSNMRTLKFKAQPTNAFFATANQVFGGSSQQHTRKLEETAEHLIDGSEKRICRLSFEC